VTAAKEEMGTRPEKNNAQRVEDLPRRVIIQLKTHQKQNWSYLHRGEVYTMLWV
jgi:hypothetical protein